MKYFKDKNSVKDRDTIRISKNIKIPAYLDDMLIKRQNEKGVSQNFMVIQALIMYFKAMEDERQSGNNV